MPTLFTHPAVPLAIGLGLGTKTISPRLLLAGVIASMLPDADVVSFRLGIAYGDALGHRGASHSLVFAAGLAALSALLARPLRAVPRTAFWFVGLAAASHGLLDMLTNGGHGVALAWPLSEARHFFPFQPIEAAPLSLRRLFGAPGLPVLTSELTWVWMPLVALGLGLRLGRR